MSCPVQKPPKFQTSRNKTRDLSVNVKFYDKFNGATNLQKYVGI